MDISRFEVPPPKVSYATDGLDGKFYNFGLVPVEERTDEQSSICESVVKTLPNFEITGRQADKKRTQFTTLWKHPIVINANGIAFPGVHQITGSCVGAGGGNALTALAIADAVIRGDAEIPLFPFWLLPYGRSRFYLGSRSKGEGSSGTTFAKAVGDDGTIPANTEGLPQFKTDDGLIWGQEAELDWSDGNVPEKYATMARKFLVKSRAKLTSADQVREALSNFYPVTQASNWGGLMKPPIKNGVLLNQRTTVWSHQMSFHDWWEHPELGEIFWIQNQWGINTHGICPSGQPGGGFWVEKSEVEWICRTGEVFAFSQWDGFPAQNIDWYI